MCLCCYYYFYLYLFLFLFSHFRVTKKKKGRSFFYFLLPRSHWASRYYRSANNGENIREIVNSTCRLSSELLRRPTDVALLFLFLYSFILFLFRNSVFLIAVFLVLRSGLLKLHTNLPSSGVHRFGSGPARRPPSRSPHSFLVFYLRGTLSVTSATLLAVSAAV